ncbi:AEC family transporter, partial [Lactobacillus delbrueckii subsp. bulgaricus]|nr:AEC family transporter [Lactobacillus delbrueckii subsp. bulgaricus]
IMAAAPVAGFIVMLSLLANRPVAFPMRSLMSVVSVPLIIMLASWLKQLV